VDIAALLNCLTSSSCVITQVTGGLIIGMLLFLVAVGLTLIFGVLKVINFTHGSFYMLGAYFGLTIFRLTDSYLLTVVGAGLATALVALIFERFFISRVYGRNVLMQLLVCYGFILIFDDLVKLFWGAEFKSMGMPSAFRVPPYFIAGGVVPPFYLFLVAVTSAIALALWLGIEKTRLGKTIRAAAQNPGMVSALGVNTGLLYGLVFALGGLLAGLAGALAAPVRSLTPGM
jgi:branched-chain amino acid transport system permease protein